jgi:hypothetical protein
VVIGGLFLTLALVSGGIWFARRTPLARRCFLACLGVAALCGALFSAIVGLFVPLLLILAWALLIIGLILGFLSFQTPLPTRSFLSPQGGGESGPSPEVRRQKSADL